MRRASNLSGVAAILVAGGVFHADPVRADDGPNGALRQELAALQQRVAELQSAGNHRQTEMAAAIESALRDAERRSQLLADGGGGAGYDNGFFISTGDFSLRPGIAVQFRHVTDYRDNTASAKTDEIESGFEIRRLELSLDGTAFAKNLRYRFYWQTRSDASVPGAADAGSLFLDDAFIRYMFNADWGVRAGQFRPPFTHEKLIANMNPLAVERSLLDQLLGGGWFERVQGVSLIYGGQAKDNPLNVEAAFHDGSNSRNSSYVGHYPADPAAIGHLGAPGNHAFDFGVHARVEWKPLGAWADYNDFSATAIKQALLVLGAGVEWNQGGNGDEIGGTFDVQYKHPGGFAVYGAALAHHVTDDLSATGDDFTDGGLLLQLSYALNPQWEPFVRWAMVKYDDDLLVGADPEDTFHEICVGVNYFLGANGSAGYRARVTVDVGWLPHGAPAKLVGLGYLGDSGGEDEVALRAQFTLKL